MFEATFNAIDRVLWKEEGCNTELDYTEQASWLLFLKYLYGLEQDKATEAALEGKKYTYILDESFRWDTWASPKGADGKLGLTPIITTQEMCAEMCEEDLRQAQKQALLRTHGYAT